ncbi:unnamed protein product, partial [Adineta ricciae]
MSDCILSTHEEVHTRIDNTVTPYLPLGEYVQCGLYCVAQMFMNIEEIKTICNAQHENEKHKFNQLNDRLNLLIDHVKRLELQNAEYTEKLALLRQESFDVEFDERYIQLETDLKTANYKKIDHEFEYQRFQIHSDIYQQLMYAKTEFQKQKQIKLQEELNQSSCTLTGLRKSYTELENQIKTDHTERDNILQQYLQVTTDWGHCKKQTSQVKINIQTLKNQHVFYKNIHSFISTNSFTAAVFDVKQYWTVKSEKILANIRHDYELLYASIYQEINTYYEKRMKEVQISFEQISVEQKKYYQEIESTIIKAMQERFQIEYEEVQQMYIKEKELKLKLETNISSLESEYELIKVENEEKYEAQSKDLHLLQE